MKHSSRRCTETGSPALSSSNAATATGLATVSRQPRLPHRQIGPDGAVRENQRSR
jgi:hypothetical protein